MIYRNTFEGKHFHSFCSHETPTLDPIAFSSTFWMQCDLSHDLPALIALDDMSGYLDWQ